MFRRLLTVRRYRHWEARKHLWMASLFFMLTVTLPAFAQKNVTLKSPDKNLVFTFRLTPTVPVYRVEYKGSVLIDDSELSLSFQEGGKFGENLKMLKPHYSKTDKYYNLVVGKAKTVRNYYREAVIPLVERNGNERKINLVVRAFNDGLGFRYEFPGQDHWKSYVMLDENTSFNIAQNPTVYTLFWGYYNNSHEGFYNKLSYNEIKADTLMDMPALFEFPENIYMAITEANLRDYAGMYLKKHDGVLTSQLSPLQGQTDVKVKATLPHHTPWRVMLIGDRFGALMESNILTSLNEPTQIKDVSWIHPGKTTFHWWNGDITPDTTFAPGINFETNKYYIDFCARNNIDYHAVIGYGGFAWYKSDATGYGVVGANTDVTKTVPTLDMQRVCDYAKQKGVGIHVWVHWRAIYPDLEKAFTQFEKWGINGMMVDFLNRDDQEMVNIQEEILKKAAEHHLYIQFHGAYKPTGLNRTYPNEFTREGAHNYEFNKWSKEPVSPEHDLNIAFTRLLAGATDYHLGGFRTVPPDEFKTQYTRPLMTGTRCHMLAMYVVLESYLASLCDYPKAYEGQPGFEFLQKVPTVWDKTVVPTANLDEYIAIARKKGDNWYVGAINNSEARSITIDFDFLDEKTAYEAIIYEDSKDAEVHPNQLVKSTKTIKKGDKINVTLASGGGMVMEILSQ